MKIQYVENLENAIISAFADKNYRQNGNPVGNAQKFLGQVTNDFCKVYGYSRYQEIINYKLRHNIPKEISISFWEAISDLPSESAVFKNMVADRLLLTVKDFDRFAVKKNNTNFEAIVAPLAVNDHSYGKHATFKKIYKRMGVDFSKLNYKGCKRNALNDPKIKKIFIKTVRQMLAEMQEGE